MGNLFNNAQKGFLPYKGCFKHNFVLQSCLQDVRKNKKKVCVCVAWLDLKNAFESVPTEHIIRATISIVQDINTKG